MALLDLGVAFLLGDLGGDHGVAFLEPGKDLDVDAVGDAGVYFPALRLVAGAEHAHELLPLRDWTAITGTSRASLTSATVITFWVVMPMRNGPSFVVDKRFAVIVHGIVR